MSHECFESAFAPASVVGALLRTITKVLEQHRHREGAHRAVLGDDADVVDRADPRQDDFCRHRAGEHRRRVHG